MKITVCKCVYAYMIGTHILGGGIKKDERNPTHPSPVWTVPCLPCCPVPLPSNTLFKRSTIIWIAI